MKPSLPHALLVVALALPGGAAALPEDREQPIEIEADRAELDDATGRAVYSGSVRLDQGTLRVTADRLEIRTDRARVTRITAEGAEDGEPARYRQIPREGEQPVRASAETIVYDTTTETIELSGDARLEQAEDRFEGDHISYDLRTRKVAAEAGRSGAPVRMVIEPSRLREETGNGAGEGGADAAGTPPAGGTPDAGTPDAGSPEAGSGPDGR
ncbi:MAG: lipopolysaccharide transport periplasmic protein LptA [Pseudomonadales bacterium]|jgi:lipopolysaccharide export system protein LptA|nr:lipopolysaccharide transport periplasmic protein LptA [Pseudomonadales bacterium]